MRARQRKPSTLIPGPDRGRDRIARSGGKVTADRAHRAADAGIPVDDVKKMEAALTAAGKKAEIVIYPVTPHGFHADYRASYREANARDGFDRLKAWFKANRV